VDRKLFAALKIRAAAVCALAAVTASEIAANVAIRRSFFVKKTFVLLLLAILSQRSMCKTSAAGGLGRCV
jgi:hypothetical protein